MELYSELGGLEQVWNGRHMGVLGTVQSWQPHLALSPSCQQCWAGRWNRVFDWE
jgi:hypothetical protein